MDQLRKINKNKIKVAVTIRNNTQSLEMSLLLNYLYLIHYFLCPLVSFQTLPLFENKSDLFLIYTICAYQNIFRVLVTPSQLTAGLWQIALFFSPLPRKLDLTAMTADLTNLNRASDSLHNLCDFTVFNQKINKIFSEKCLKTCSYNLL